MSVLSGKDRFKSWLPHGFHFVGPAESARLVDLIEKYRSHFKAHKYDEVMPPLLDFAQTFDLVRAAENSFETTDRSGERLAIRSDITVQIAKAAASGTIKTPGSYSYIQPVVTDQSWGSGHRRQLHQAGAETLGAGSNRLDTMLSVLRSAPGLAKMKLLYGDQGFLSALLSGLSEPAQKKAYDLLDKKDAAAIAQFAKSEIKDSVTSRIFQELPYSVTEDLGSFAAKLSAREDLLSFVNSAPRGPGIVYDFGLVRDLSYYTGGVFIGYIEGLQDAVCAGGVYDSLLQRFEEKSVPACGFAVNLTLLSQIV